MPATTGKMKIPYSISNDKISDYPVTSKSLAERVDAFISVMPALSVSGALAGSASGTLTTRIENMTTNATSITGGVYVDLPDGPWKGIAAIEVTPRNNDGSPLMCSVEKITLTQILIRFAKHDGLYYTTGGVPVTLRITGWK